SLEAGPQCIDEGRVSRHERRLHGHRAKDRTIYINGQKIKKEREAKIRAVERLKAARREFVRISDKQEEALHTFLSDPETQAIFDKKCPPGTQHVSGHQKIDLGMPSPRKRNHTVFTYNEPADGKVTHNRRGRQLFCVLSYLAA
ncbi:unnamed protein product, partial [Pylaiella littoralis]